MTEFNYKEVAFTNRNNRTLNDFKEDGSVSVHKKKISEIIEDIQKFLAEEHSTLITEVLSGKVSREALTKLIDEHLSTSTKAKGLVLKDVVKNIIDTMVGWERLQPLIEDDKVTEIMTNEDLEVIKRVKGADEITNIKFENDEEIEQFIKNIALRTGEKINRDICILDAMDKISNIRINAGIYGSPVRKGEVVKKPYFILRKYVAKNFTKDDFIENGTFSEEIYKMLQDVSEESTIMIVGEPEAGKSTFLEFIKKLKDPMRRTINIEEEAEFIYKNKNSVSFEERKISGEETRKKYDMAEFAKIATRLSGKDVAIGEVRGKEAWYLFRLLDMGYRAIYTIHGDSCESGIEQTAFLMSLENPNLTYTQLMSKISKSVDFVVYISNKKVVNIAEITGYNIEADQPILNYVFKLKVNENDEFYWQQNEISKEYRDKLKLKRKLKDRRV